MRMSFEKHHAFSAVLKMRLAQNETIAWVGANRMPASTAVALLERTSYKMCSASIS